MEPDPRIEIRQPLEGETQHLFVIPHQRNHFVKSPPLRVVDNISRDVESPQGVRAPVDQVAELNQQVSVMVACAFHKVFQEFAKFCRSTVDIANHANAHALGNSRGQGFGIC